MSTLDTQNVVGVLIIEDNPLDAQLVRRALENERNWRVRPILAVDGERAIAVLETTRGRGDVDLVILDLNLPKRDGTEVLRFIRTADTLRKLPVVVLSSSPADVIKAKIMNANVEANCYITKPIELTEYLNLGSRLRNCYEQAITGSDISSPADG